MSESTSQTVAYIHDPVVEVELDAAALSGFVPPTRRSTFLDILRQSSYQEMSEVVHLTLEESK